MTSAAPGTLRRRGREVVDRFIGFDPGLTQLRNAAHAILALALAVTLGYVLESSTGALRIEGRGLPPQLVAAQHHGALIISMLLPGIIAMLDSTGVNDGSIRRRLISSAGLLITFYTAMTVGLVVAEHRLPLLVWLVIAPMIAVYIRRFPTRGFVLGVALFNGTFMSYFMHDQIHFHDLGWVAALLALGTIASVAVRLLVFRPDTGHALIRMQHAWIARTHTVAKLAWQLTDDDLGPHRREHVGETLQRQLVRLNESSLMIDALLADPEALEGSAMLLHQRLFDQELALSNIARFTRALTGGHLDARVRAGLRATLAALGDQELDQAVARARDLERVQVDLDAGTTPTIDAEGLSATTTVLVHRLARSVADLAEAQEQWVRAGRERVGTPVTFVPAVQLLNGYLPGSAPVSEIAGGIPGRGPLDRTVLKPYVRSSLQIGVAAAIAVTIGDVVDGKRLYWALLATFLSFMATSNSGEQVRKAFFRLLGTAVGIVLGDGLVHLADRNLAVSLVVIGIAMFVGFYLVRVNYLFLVVGLTITMSQLYVQLNEFSWHLLVLRLAETAVGVGGVVVAVLVVFPLRPGRVLAAAISKYLEALENLTVLSLGTLSRVPAGYEARPPTRLDVRALDAAYQSLLVTAGPLRFGLFGHRATRLNEGLAVASAARYYARNLAAGVEYSDVGSTPDLDAATARLLTSLRALRTDVGRSAGDGISEGTGPGYVRSAALFDEAYRRSGADSPNGLTGTRLVIRDIMLLDGALARLAAAQGLPVVATDTAGVDLERSRV